MHKLQMSDASYDWLLGHIENIEAKFRKDPGTWVDRIEFVELINALRKELLATEHEREAKPAASSKKKAPRSTPTRMKEGCKEHPNYGAQRPPRTGCEGCWAAYKAYNPLKYPAAWRKHLRKQTDTTKD